MVESICVPISVDHAGVVLVDLEGRRGMGVDPEWPQGVVEIEDNQ